MFSAIDAEHDLGVVKKAIALTKKKFYPNLSPHEKEIAKKILKEIWKYCGDNIQE
jgi:hypothetical protein